MSKHSTGINPGAQPLRPFRLAPAKHRAFAVGDTILHPEGVSKINGFDTLNGKLHAVIDSTRIGYVMYVPLSQAVLADRDA